MLKDKKIKKPSKKDLIEAEWPIWEKIDLELQDVLFFKKVRQLCLDGLDPKGDITDQYCTTADLINLFGSSNTFKCDAPNLKTKDMKALRDIYWRVNGHAHVPNGLYQQWYAKGYAAQKNSHLVNWEKAAATTTAELNRRKSISGLSKAKPVHPAEDLEGSDVDGSGPETTTVVKTEKSYGQYFSADQVLNVVDQLELTRVEEFFELKQDLWKYSKTKARVLED
jgi:hypothetical protein